MKEDVEASNNFIEIIKLFQKNIFFYTDNDFHKIENTKLRVRDI
jgi:hypothetical protein